MSTPAVIVTTREELEQFITAAVERALAGQREDAAPVLLDRAGIARALGVSQSTVGRLLKEGLVHVRIGDSPRFEVSACLAWLRTHGEGERPE